MNMKEKAIETVNGPAMTLIYRGAMAIAIGVIIWFGSEFLQHKDNHSVADRELAVALERLSVTLENNQQQMADRYTATDAREDKTALNNRITTLSADLSRRIDDFNVRIRDMERNQR